MYSRTHPHRLSLPIWEHQGLDVLHVLHVLHVLYLAKGRERHPTKRGSEADLLWAPFSGGSAIFFTHCLAKHRLVHEADGQVSILGVSDREPRERIHGPSG